MVWVRCAARRACQAERGRAQNPVRTEHLDHAQMLRHVYLRLHRQEPSGQRALLHERVHGPPADERSGLPDNSGVRRVFQVKAREPRGFDYESPLEPAGSVYV